MARANTIQTNFTAGEISPILRGRVDISRYLNGAATLKNFIVKPQGGIFTRPGTVFIQEVKDSTKRTRLYDFEYSETVNYLLEFGNQYVRIFKNNAYVGTEVVTPYLEADLPFLKFTQSADVLYICHPAYQTRKLIRTSDVIWAMSLFQSTDGPYLPVNSTDTKLRIANYTDVGYLSTTEDSFDISSVGKFMEYLNGSIPMLAEITEYVSARVVGVVMKENVIAPLDPVAVLTRAASKITSSHAIFSNSNIGNYIKLSTGSWDFVTGYVSETEVSVTPGVHAELDLATEAAGNLDTVVEATADGPQGNDIFLQLVGDSAAAANVTINVVGNAVVIHFEDGVSTVADVEAAIAALTGTDDLIGVKTAGTGATVLNAPGDEFSGANLLGGRSSVDLQATSGIITQTTRDIASNVLSSSPIFAATDVDRHIRLNFSGEQVWGTIFAFVDTSTVAVHWDRPIPLMERDVTKLIDDGLTELWRLGAWGATTGYPSVVTFHEERLVFAASPLEPQTFWMSVSGEYENFAPTDTESKVLDDNAITFTIASNKVNGIRWAISGPTLVFGTMGGEWQVSASSIKEALTPTNITVVQHSSHGSGHLRPVKIGAAVMFMQKSGTKLRELLYDYQTDSLVAKDVTIISEHILRRGTKSVELAYQQEPNSVLWVALDDGGLAGLTYVRDQEVYAWHYHEIGGSFGASKAVVESVSCIPAESGTYDTLYLIVKRTIAGVTKRYIEYINLEYDPPTETSREDLYYVDCGKQVTVAATSSTTLAHLPSTTISILANGSVRPNVVSTEVGVVAFSGGAATRIAAGIPYESLLVTLPPEAGGEAGTAQGKTKRMHRSKIRVYKSMGFKYGPSESKLSQYNFRSTLDPMDSSPRIRSDDVPLTMDNPNDVHAQITIKRDQPYPLNILAVMPEFVTNE